MVCHQWEPKPNATKWKVMQKLWLTWYSCEQCDPWTSLILKVREASRLRAVAMETRELWWRRLDSLSYSNFSPLDKRSVQNSTITIILSPEVVQHKLCVSEACVSWPLVRECYNNNRHESQNHVHRLVAVVIVVAVVIIVVVVFFVVIIVGVVKTAVYWLQK